VLWGGVEALRLPELGAAAHPNDVGGWEGGRASARSGNQGTCYEGEGLGWGLVVAPTIWRRRREEAALKMQGGTWAFRGGHSKGGACSESALGVGDVTKGLKGKEG
jgi:hypothetical protein